MKEKVPFWQKNFLALRNAFTYQVGATLFYLIIILTFQLSFDFGRYYIQNINLPGWLMIGAGITLSVNYFNMKSNSVRLEKEKSKKSMQAQNYLEAMLVLMTVNVFTSIILGLYVRFLGQYSTEINTKPSITNVIVNNNYGQGILVVIYAVSIVFWLRYLNQSAEQKELVKTNEYEGHN